MVFLMCFNGKYLVFYLDFLRTFTIFAKKLDSSIIKIQKKYGKSREEWNY